MFFEDSKPERKKRAHRLNGGGRLKELADAPIPPAQPYELLSYSEMREQRTLIFDTESFKNYWLCAFKCTLTGKLAFFENSPDASIDTSMLSYLLFRHRIVGFHSETYDIPMIQLALTGKTAEELNACNFMIIDNGMRPYDVRREFKLRQLELNHIDLKEVAPLAASLKIYGGRIHCPRMQDLPFPPDMILSKSQAEIARDYCGNDLDNTHLLFDDLEPQLTLRESLGREYGHDLRSRSDAQIAEHVIGSELDKLGARQYQKRKIEPGWTFQYQVPEWLDYQTPQLQGVLDAVRASKFVVGNGGYADCPDSITALRIALGGCIFQMGAGGLHSSEVSQGYTAGPDRLIIDRDVASYYPAIILNQGLYPAHLGPDFLKVYRGIVNKRLKAKLDKNKVASEGLKITINGTFGKLGNYFSRLYAPDLLMQVTISGQLCLLKLIEMIELAGIPVLSANTDGVVIGCPPNRYDDLMIVIHTWEDLTGFITEETRYKSIWSRDVNNYIAIKEDNTTKVKGCYSEVGSALNSRLSKNPECQIISDAVQAFLAHNKPIDATIRACQDIRKFVSVRTVKGGAEKNGVYLGKAIRWYYAEGETGEINYVLTGNKVPKTFGAKPLMTLPQQLPFDLDYNYYIKEADEALYDIGYKIRPRDMTLFV